MKSKAALGEHAPANTGDRPWVLIVDDDVTVRSLGAHNLGLAEFEVTAVSEGTAVVPMFLERLPDAVFLDVMLPDVNGIDLCRSLRGIPEAEHVPIVMLTSLNDERSIRMAFEAGATEFVVKPINWLHELYRLRYILRSAGILRNLDRARVEITRAKQEWDLTFDAIEDPVLILNPDLTVRHANHAAIRMSSGEIDTLIGRQCYEIFTCNRFGSDECPAKQSLDSGAPVQTELRGFGRSNWDCLVSVAPVSGGDGPNVLVYSIKDLTKYHEIQRELLQSQKMEALGVLAAGVAHDFNNLLQGLMGWTDILAMEVPTESALTEGLAQISSIATRGRALTQQLLFSSRTAEGKKSDVSIESLLAEIAALLSRTQPKTIKIEVDDDDDLWIVRADASHLHQALMNLAVNAGHAMPNGGHLCLKARNVTIEKAYAVSHPGSHVGPHVMIVISDTGTGIPKEILPRIYDPFFTTKPQGKGTGLGLSIVFGIVKDHGGHISCYTEPGKGTTFSIYLPAQESQNSEATMACEAKKSPTTSGEGKTVLVAEDEPIIMNLLTRALEQQDYKVLHAVNGEEALKCYLSRPDQVDGIILDMNMPVMDGETCLRELFRHGVKVPVLLATGSLLSSERESELLSLASAIVNKPFHFAELFDTLNQELCTKTTP